jgi:low temperature requirement protein LtrA
MRLWGERARPDLHHLSERVGLFTIIVLGESFIKVVIGATGNEHLPLGAAGAFGMLIVVSLWWIYFDHSAATEIASAPRARFVWFFSHLPLATGAIILGVTLKQVVLTGSSHSNDAGSAWMLLGSLALCWSVLAILELVTESHSAPNRSSLAIGRFIGALVLIAFGIMGGSLGEEFNLTLAVLVCVAMVIQDVFWQRARISLSSR